MSRDWSDEHLNALVDGELTPADAEALLAEVAADEALRRRACDLQLAKELVRHAYGGVTAPSVEGARASRRRSWTAATALGAVFATGGLLGWVANGAAPRGVELAGAGGVSVQAQTALTRVILHVATDEPEVGQAALDQAQALIESAQAAGHPVAVEIVANGSGLDLLRTGASAQGPRLAAMHAAYPDLSLVACGQTVQKLRDAGIAVQLLPGTVVASSALDEIVLRMKQGWTYLRI